MLWLIRGGSRILKRDGPGILNWSPFNKPPSTCWSHTNGIDVVFEFLIFVQVVLTPLAWIHRWFINIHLETVASNPYHEFRSISKIHEFIPTGPPHSWWNLMASFTTQNVAELSPLSITPEAVIKAYTAVLASNTVTELWVPWENRRT